MNAIVHAAAGAAIGPVVADAILSRFGHTPIGIGFAMGSAFVANFLFHPIFDNVAHWDFNLVRPPPPGTDLPDTDKSKATPIEYLSVLLDLIGTIWLSLWIYQRFGHQPAMLWGSAGAVLPDFFSWTPHVSPWFIEHTPYRWYHRFHERFHFPLNWSQRWYTIIAPAGTLILFMWILFLRYSA